MYDVAVIGAGICGCAAAFYLSRCDVKVCVIDSQPDVSMGTTKANSAIIHAGYDPAPNTLMAKLNVEGSRLCQELASELGFPYSRIGSYVLAFSEGEAKQVQELYERGRINGVEGLEIHDREQVLAHEPNVCENVVCGLWAPTAAIVSPWGYCLALAENAAVNGVKFILSTEVTDIKKSDGMFVINDSIKAKYIINAAGCRADEVCGMLGEREFDIFPSKGQYYLLDKNHASVVNSVLFQCPDEVLGKGVLVSRTAGGNLIVGPNAEPFSAKGDLSVDRAGLDYVMKAAAKTTKKINYRDNVRCFAGLRANSDRSDFIIEKSRQDSHFINVAGIKSPGLSSAPAIAKMAISLLESEGLTLNAKSEVKYAERRINFSKLSTEKKAELIKKDPSYGSVVCRCGTVTEGEVLAALRSPITPRTLDGIKRRCGTGMGRCQGAFCSPRVHELISNVLGVPYDSICQEREGSWIVCGEIGGDCND